MKTRSVLIPGILGLASAVMLMAFSNSKNDAQALNAYLSIVASASTESMIVTVSMNSKPYRELKYYNRKTAYDVTPALNIVVENEKRGYELYSSQMSYDNRSNRMVYMFLMRKRI